jgi:hypothetical protein
VPKILRAILGLVAGYLVGASLGAAAIDLFSSNTHDKSMEAAMTGAFVTGPIGAILGLIIALVWRRQNKSQ